MSTLPIRRTINHKITNRSKTILNSATLNIPRRHKPDYWLLISTITLMLVGLIVLYSIGPALVITNGVNANYFAIKQLIAVSLGLVAFFIATRVPLIWWKTTYKPLLIFAALTTLAAIVLPVNPNYPAHRWVRLGSFSFQSVEVVKFAVIVWIAGFLATKIKQGLIKNVRAVFIPLAIALLVMGVIIVGIQSDLGSMGVIVAVMTAMAYVAGLPLKRIVLIAIAIAFLAVIAVVTSPYRLARVETYLHPQSNCQGSGYQARQSLISVGSGGLIGLGLGKSVQAYGYVPEASNDSIFAIFSEKFGFIGAVILVGIFVLLFNHLKNISERLEDDFLRLIVIGVFTWLSTQTLINIGSMIGLFPLKGITLPFISYGGTSIVFSAAAVGLVFQISRYTSGNVVMLNEAKKGNNNENFGNRRRIRGAYHSNTGRRG